MRWSFRFLAAITCGVPLFAGCGGATVQPHVRVRTSDPPLGSPPSVQLNPRPDLERVDSTDTRPVVDQICRVQPMPSGWIAVRYLPGAENCPESTDPENPYTAAVIQRFSQLPVGASLVVCADQPIPRDWVRDYNRDVRASCDGARVRNDTPTVMVIRRVSRR